MILREYRSTDAAVICSWIRTEEELYKWSADRFNKFPMPDYIMNIAYSEQIRGGRFIPLTAIEDTDIVGHFIIRYPDEDDNSTVRFGFVIINPKYRCKGYGKEMLRRGIKYVKEELKADRIDLGVFENNPNANHLYKTMGFRAFAQRKVQLPIGTWNCIDMELFLNKE